VTTPSTSDPNHWVRAAEQNRKAGHLGLALQLYGQALDIDQKTVSAYIGIGRVHALRKDRKRSGVAYAMAYRHGSRTFEVLEAVARGLQSEGQRTQAIKLYELAITKNPKHAATRQNLTSAYLQVGRPTAALEQAEIAIELAPESQAARVNHGAALSALDRHAEALASYEIAGTLGRMGLPLVSNTAQAAIGSGAYSRGAALLDGLVQVEPTERRYLQLAYARFQLGDHDRALRAYHHATQLNMKCTAAWNGLGVVLMSRFKKEGSRDERLRHLAMRLWRKSIDINPDQPNVVGLIKRHQS
jgi:tetratricopeptide (TPR) repeat protein